MFSGLTANCPGFPPKGKRREAMLRRLREAGRIMFAKDASAALALSAKLREPAPTVSPPQEIPTTTLQAPE